MKTKKPQQRLRIWFYFALLAVQLSFAVSLRAEDAAPLVEIAFNIRAADFRTNLTDTNRTDIESKVMEQLATLCSQYFGFLKWIPKNHVEDSSKPAAHLKVTLVGQRVGFASRISLKYSKVVNGQDMDLQLKEDWLLLYRAWDDQPTHNRGQLKSDIFNKLVRQFANDDFRDKLHEQFLSTISLTRDVNVITPDKRLIIPISATALRMRDGTILLVKFISNIPQSGGPKDGIIRVEKDGMSYVDPYRGYVRAVILLFNYPPVRVEGWHDRVPIVLQHKVADTLKVFMEKYSPDPNPGTRGSLVTSPE